VEITAPITCQSNRRLLYVGRLNRKKGIEELLRAIALLRRTTSRVTLDVVGTGNAAYTSKLRKLAHSLKLNRCITWHGYKPLHEIRSLYSSYGAVVVPSHQESFGLVALEALAGGVPLISTRSGGLSEFVDTSVAEVIPRITPLEISKSIRRFWLDTGRAEVRVANGRKRARHYEWRNVAERYARLFEQLRDAKRGDGVGGTPVETHS
jgi:glycogen(starch) synthase